MKDNNVMNPTDIERVNDTHSLTIGYILWIFGFTGSHRFYYGKPISGTIWFCTFGLLGIGWLVDLFLIPAMDHEADTKYNSGRYDYNITWVLLTFLGIFGVHRFYLGRYISAVIYFFTGGFFFFGVIYDFWKINELVDEANKNGPPLYR